MIDFVLKILGGLWKFILEKFLGQKPSINQNLNMKAGRNIAVEGDINIINLQTEGFSLLKKQVENSESKLKETLKEFMRLRQEEKHTTRSNTVDYKLVMDLRKGGPSKENKTQLRTIFYSSNDNLARLQAVLVLANWCRLPKDSINDLIAMCDEGIKIADLISATSEKAVLLAYKGRFISVQFSDTDMDAAFNIKLSNVTGIPLITEEKRQQTIQKLRELDKLSQECFASAQKIAKEAKSLEALALVYSLIGSAAGHRYIHLKHFGVARAEEEKQLSKRALLLAKDIYSATGDEISTAYALHNLANELRIFGEKDEAKQITEKVKNIATKYNDQQLLKKANVLMDRIISGKIPNYTGGEEFEL